MRERHFQTGDKHPSACTCADCHRKRMAALEAASRPKKRRKPKSQRGKPRHSTPDSSEAESSERAARLAVEEALRILGTPPPESKPQD